LVWIHFNFAEILNLTSLSRTKYIATRSKLDDQSLIQRTTYYLCMTVFTGQLERNT